MPEIKFGQRELVGMEKARNGSFHSESTFVFA